MPRKIFSLSLLVIGFLCMHHGSRPATRTHTPEVGFQDIAIPATQVTDLSGRYVGMLDYAEDRFSGAATLTIHGNKFTLRGNGLNLNGTLEVIQSEDRRLAITLRINPAPISTAAGPKKVLLLKGTVSNGRFIITTPLSDRRTFYFSGLGVTASRKTPSVDISTDIAGGAANPAATPATTNANVNTIPMVGNSGTDARVLKPRMKIKATSAEPPNATSNSNVNNPVSNSNTNNAAEPSLYDQLKDNAHAVFTTPSSMRFEETTDIELLVSPTKSTAELESELTERGRSGNATTQYSKMMEAQLVGHGFNIAPVGPSIQPVEPGKTTRWKWQIKPKEGGAQRLDLTLNAVLNDGKDRILLQTLHREITVNVKLSQRAAGWLSGLKDIQWLWAAIIVPIGTLAIAWWRRKKRKPKTRKKK